MTDPQTPMPPPEPDPSAPGQPAAGGYQTGGHQTGGQPADPVYPPAGNLPLVPNGKRFGAYLLDVLLTFVTCGIGWFVWSLIIWGRGQTPAKQLLKLRCVDARTGQLASYGQMALRELVGKYLLSSVTFGISTLVGAVMILGDKERRQGVWDKIGSTMVVDDPHDSLAPQQTPLT